jgi:hypothetical protein
MWANLRCVRSPSSTGREGRGRPRRTSPAAPGGYRAQYTSYDIADRVSAKTNPTEINGLWNPAGDDTAGWNWTTQTYDWKDRPLVTTLPKLNPSDPNEQATTQEVSYGGCGCAGGDVVTTKGESIPNLGRRTQNVYHDPLGRAWKTEDLNWDGSVYRTTTTKFNVLGEPVRVRDYVGAAPQNEPDAEGSGYQTTTMTYDGHGRLQTEHKPEQDAGKYTNYTYNLDDTVNVMTDARGATTTYGYNNRGLVSAINYGVAPGATKTWPDTSNVAYGYDEADNRVWMTDGLGRVDYNYDSMSHMMWENRQFNLASNPTSSDGKYKLWVSPTSFQC